MGFQFTHVGGGTKTRRPVALHLRFNPRCHVPHCRLLAGSGGGEGEGGADDDAGVAGRPMPLAEIQAYIEAENMRLENDPCQFSEKEIIIRIEYMHCPNLTIIDTPGLILPAPGSKNRVLQSQACAVEALVGAKIQHEETIIPCLEDCNDWSNAPTRRVVMQVDLDLARTVIVSVRYERFLFDPVAMVRGARSVSPTPARGSGGSGRWFQGSASGGGVSAMITGSGGGQNLVAQTAPRETGVSLKYPVLTRTNYTDWALLMRVNLQAQGVWDAVDSGGAEFRVDRMALAAILQAVPPEMLDALATKSTAKSAWEAIKTMRMGVERVREARLELGSIKRPPITREEIVNACGVEDVHDGTNYSRTACVIAVAKAHDTFEPFLHQVSELALRFGFRLLYILKRPFPTSVFLLEKDGGHFSSHDVLVKRVQAAFNKFAKSTEQSCRERCMEDLEGTTRYVTRSLHNKNRAGLWHFLDSFVALEQLSVNTHTAHSTGLHDQSSGLNDSKQNRSKGDSISFHSSDANSPAPVSEARLVDVLHSTLWNRRLAPSSERLVYALVHQIFHGIKEHFLVTTELKFNCFLLMPIVDKLPALLREDLRSALEDDLDSILDVTTAPLTRAEEARAGD